MCQIYILNDEQPSRPHISFPVQIIKFRERDLWFGHLLTSFPEHILPLNWCLTKFWFNILWLHRQYEDMNIHFHLFSYFLTLSNVTSLTCAFYIHDTFCYISSQKKISYLHRCYNLPQPNEHFLVKLTLLEIRNLGRVPESMMPFSLHLLHKLCSLFNHSCTSNWLQALFQSIYRLAFLLFSE